jgi:hypothetical protein
MARRTARHPISGPMLTADSRLGDYRVGDLDAALARSERSDPLSLALRLALVGVVYALLARAVSAGAPAQALVLPLLVELLAVFAVGSAIGLWPVNCPTFRRSMGGPIARLLCVVVLAALVVGLLASLPGWSWRDALDPARVLPWAMGYGLHWPILAAVAGLVVHSAHEALDWRARGGVDHGVFVWTSIQFLATRIAVMIVIALLIGIPLAIFVPGIAEAAGGLGRHAGLVAWCCFGLLLAVDVGATIVLALMHRDAIRAATGASVRAAS